MNFRLSSIRFRYFFPMCFLILLIVNVRHLTDPPYWDALLGVYRQGIWLLHHGFDYSGLLRQPDYISGGPRGHVFCAQSLLFALLSTWLSPPAVWLILHMLVLVAAAASLSIFFWILREWVPAGAALWWVLVAASNPIWSGQAISLYLEIPLAAMLSVSFLYLYRGNYRVAAAFCLLAYTAKNAALLQAAAFAVMAMLLIGFRVRRFREVIWLFLPMPVMLFLDRLAGDTVLTNRFILMAVPKHVIRTLSLSPYLYPALILQGVLLLALGAWWFRKQTFSSIQNSIQSPRGASVLFLSLFVLAFWGSFLMTPRSLVRYTVMVDLPMAALAAIFLGRYPRASIAVACSLVLFQLVNYDGRLLPAIPEFVGRSGDRLERSREYLKDLRADQELAHLLEQHAGAEPVLAKWPFSILLHFPELGYVSHPIAGLVDVNQPPDTETRDSAIALRAGRNRKTLCVFAPSIFEISGVSLQPRPGDGILWVDHRLPAPLALFERQWTKEEWTAPKAGT